MNAARKRVRSRLGAATDDPAALAKRALIEAERALAAKDPVAFRQAAETGWLAASSSADVAAARLKLPIPGGASGRQAVLTELERRARLRRGALLTTFGAAQEILHGRCFHGDACEPASVLGILESVAILATDVTAALGSKRTRKTGPRGR
jgi:hypothetical protein